MTTVVWDGKNLVADTRVTTGEQTRDWALKVEPIAYDLQLGGTGKAKDGVVIALGIAGSVKHMDPMIKNIEDNGEAETQLTLWDILHNFGKYATTRLTCNFLAVVDMGKKREKGTERYVGVVISFPCCDGPLKFHIPENRVIGIGSGWTRIPLWMRTLPDATAYDYACIAASIDKYTGGRILSFNASKRTSRFLPKIDDKRIKELGTLVAATLIDKMRTELKPTK